MQLQQRGSCGTSAWRGSVWFSMLTNYGAIDAFVKGSSTSKRIRDILLAFERCEATRPTWPWFSRVPSASNCADDPSRRVLDKFVGETFLRERCLCPLTRVFLEDLTS